LIGTESNDLERHNKGFLDFSAVFGLTHILKANCAEIIKDIQGQFAYKTFSIKRSFR